MNSAPAPNPDGPQATARKPRIKLDTDLYWVIIRITLIGRLLSDRGFRYLRTQALNIDYAGPGHELEDLDRLMLFYREWAHYLFPEARFSDFVAKVRKECSGRVMRQYLEELRRNNEMSGLGGLVGGFDADFAEVNTGLNEALDILKKQDERQMDTGKEKVQEDAPNFEDLDFGHDLGWSDEELLQQFDDNDLE